MIYLIKKLMFFSDKTLVSVFLITLVSNSAYAIMAPFLPFEFDKKNISQSLIGYIFAIYSLAVIVSSPILGYLIAHIGRRPLIRLGVFLMGFSFIIFATLDKMQNTYLYVGGALFARFIQGFASSSIQTTCYSICTNFYPEHREALVGYLEAVCGIGLIVGPIMGSVMYSMIGFASTFYCFGLFFMVAALLVYFCFQPLVDTKTHQYTR